MRRRLRIIVVDDDSSVCRALARLLRTSKMDVETHASAEEYLRALNRHEPDCLVLDIRMPAMTGPELRQRLLDEGYDIPVVFITAHAEDGGAENRGSTAGVDILHKPFDNQVLLDAIHRAIGQRKPR